MIRAVFKYNEIHTTRRKIFLKKIMELIQNIEYNGKHYLKKKKKKLQIHQV